MRAMFVSLNDVHSTVLFSPFRSSDFKISNRSGSLGWSGLVFTNVIVQISLNLNFVIPLSTPATPLGSMVSNSIKLLWDL